MYEMKPRLAVIGLSMCMTLAATLAVANDGQAPMHAMTTGEVDGLVATIEADADTFAGMSADRQAEIAALGALAPAAGPQAGADAAAQTIEQLADEALRIMRDDQLDAAGRQAQFMAMLDRELDTDLLARIVLGKHWRRASAAEKERFVATFREFVVQTFARQLTSARIEDFQILSSRDGGKKDKLVATRIRHEGQDHSVIWRLRERQGKYYILDFMAEGVSMALTRRQEFTTILQQNGGDISALIQSLEERTVG